MNETVEMRWLPIAEQPEFMERPGRQFIRVEGWSTHTGGQTLWHRIYCGIAFIRPAGHPEELHGYRREDMERIMKEGDMDGIDEVTHWMPARWPAVTGRREP